MQAGVGCLGLSAGGGNQGGWACLAPAVRRVAACASLHICLASGVRFSFSIVALDICEITFKVEAYLYTIVEA